MSELHKIKRTTRENIDSKEEQRMVLCSNNTSSRCSSLGFIHNSKLVTDDIAMSYLASILVRVFLHRKKYERNSEQKRK